MATFGSRRGVSDKFSLPLMILAFVAVGGFLYWLNTTAQPTEVTVVQDDTGDNPGTSAILDVDDFLGNPGRWEGQVVEVTGARVSSRLGTQAFWISPSDPNATPFLVKMGPEVMEAGTDILLQQMVVAVGTVRVMNDSILAAWDADGAFASEGDRTVAEFAIGSPYLEASSVEAQGGGATSDLD